MSAPFDPDADAPASNDAGKTLPSIKNAPGAAVGESPDAHASIEAKKASTGQAIPPGQSGKTPPRSSLVKRLFAAGRRWFRAEPTTPAKHIQFSPKTTLERAKVAYEQNCASFRSLNQLMWQVPLIAMSLTGGLWYGVSNISLHQKARLGLLILAAFANAALGLLVLPRVRRVMEGHLVKMRDFYPAGFPVPKESWVPIFGGNGGMMKVYALLLSTAAVMSAYAAREIWLGGMRPNGSVVTTVERTTTAGPGGITTTEVTRTVTTIMDTQPDPSIPARLSKSTMSATATSTTNAPTTNAPTTNAPTTNAPTTNAPTTNVPTTNVPTTNVPTTNVPTTNVPTTNAPTTSPPNRPLP
jgi:hypothetical protein